jgi:arabinogalactan oligomer / maltooligosaccharide transport system substrate-binding protein
MKKIKDEKKYKPFLKIAIQMLVYFFIVLTISVLVFTSGMFTSCAMFDNNQAEQTSETQIAPDTSDSTSSADQAMEPVEISVWIKLEPEEQIELTNSINIFMANNPEIKVVAKSFRSYEELLDQFTAASLAGAGSDLVVSEIEYLKPLARAGVIKPVPDEMVRSGILDGLNEVSVFNDKVYAIPFRAFNFLMLYYNKEFVKDPPQTFSGVIDYCKKANKPGEQTWGFLFNWKEPEWILPLVGGYQDWIYDYNSNSIFLNTGAMTSALKFLYDLYNVEKILPFDVGYEDIGNAFASGKAHMIIDGSWAVDTYKKAGIDFGVTKIPVVPEGIKNPTPMIDGTCFMFNTNSYGEKLEASKKFVNFLLSDEVQVDWTLQTKTLPVLKSIEGNPDVASDGILANQINQAIICRGKIPDDVLRVIIDSVRVNTENVMYGNISPEDASAKMQEDAIKLETENSVTDSTGNTSETPETTSEQK